MLQLLLSTLEMVVPEGIEKAKMTPVQSLFEVAAVMIEAVYVIDSPALIVDIGSAAIETLKSQSLMTIVSVKKIEYEFKRIGIKM